jgi:hypothetical protein
VATFFSPTGLPGKLVEHPWSNFGWNRKRCLDEATALDLSPPGAPPRGCTHYLLLDADDTVRGAAPDFTLKTADLEPGVDSWMIEHHAPDGQLGSVYQLKRLVSAARDWRYEGVTHEYITPADGAPDVYTALPEFQVGAPGGKG